jgi:hypothetical protein
MQTKRLYRWSVFDTKGSLLSNCELLGGRNRAQRARRVQATDKVVLGILKSIPVAPSFKL